MTEDRLSEYAPELYEALRGVLDEIPIITGDSRHDELAQRIYEANELIREIGESKDEEELKRCPFCGGEAKLWPKDRNPENFHEVSCKCGGRACGKTPKAAIEAWNRRVKDD